MYKNSLLSLDFLTSLTFTHGKDAGRTEGTMDKVKALINSISNLKIKFDSLPATKQHNSFGASYRGKIPSSAFKGSGTRSLLA